MISIPLSEISFQFSRSSGAGGQNINKVNSKATLSWNIAASPSCSEAVKKRFAAAYKRFLVGELVMISSQRFRSQQQNIDDCLQKLHQFLAEVEHPPKMRHATKPTKSSVHKRLESKKIHSFSKRLRAKKNDW